MQCKSIARAEQVNKCRLVKIIGAGHGQCREAIENLHLLVFKPYDFRFYDEKHILPHKIRQRLARVRRIGLIHWIPFL